MPYIGKKPANVPVTASDIPNDSITTAKIVDAAITIADIGPNAVGSSEMADDAVGLNELSATGTTNTSTFLRGDNSWAVPPDNNTVYTHPNHSGEVTSTADGAQVIADNVVDEANLKISNSPTNGQFLSAQSGNTGGLTWAAVPATDISGKLNLSGGTMTGNIAHAGNFTLDVGGTIILDGDEAGNNIHLKDSGTHYGSLLRNNSDFEIHAIAQDKDIVFKGNDGGSAIEAMRIDMSAAGLVGIGTSSPNAKLHVYNANDHGRLKIECAQNSGQAWMFQSRNNGEFWIRNDSGSGTNSVIINSTGSVGFGVTPQTTNTSHDAMYLGGNGTWTSLGNQGANGEMDLQHNAYFAADGNDKYISTDEATKYRQGGGKHQWYTAASGSGNISWGHAMTIANNGNVGIGTSSPASGRGIGGAVLHISDTPDAALRITDTGGSDFEISAETNTTLGTIDNTALNIITNNTNRMTVGNDGRVAIAQTGNATALQVSTSVAAETTAIFQGGGTGAVDVVDVRDSGGNSKFKVRQNGRVGVGIASPESPLHIKKFADTDTIETLLLLDCDKDSHRSGKGGSIVFQDISVYANTAEISAARVGGGSASEVKFKLRNTEILALRSDGRGLSQFTAKSWIKFNGTGTIAINDSHNVSSITDHGVGSYQVNFTNSLANANYCINTHDYSYGNGWSDTQTTSSYRIKRRNESAAYIDVGIIWSLVFGD